MWEPLPVEVRDRLLADNALLSKEREHASWDEYIEAIEQYRELVDDYDGQGAIAPADETIEGAIALIRELIAAGVATPTYAVPGPNGTVNLDWEYEGVSVSLEVIDSDTAEATALDGVERVWSLSRAVEEAA